MAETENNQTQGETLSPEHSGPASVDVRKAYLTFSVKGRESYLSFDMQEVWCHQSESLASGQCWQRLKKLVFEVRLHN